MAAGAHPCGCAAAAPGALLSPCTLQGPSSRRNSRLQEHEGWRGVILGVFLFLLMNISSVRKKKNPSASTLMCEQERWDVVGLMESHHPGQPEPPGGLCHPL